MIVREGRNYVVLQNDPTAHSELLAAWIENHHLRRSVTRSRPFRKAANLVLRIPLG